MDESLTRAEAWFSEIPGVSPELIEALITEGFLSFRDLTFFGPEELAEMAGVTNEEAEEMISYAEDRADEIEEEDDQRQAEEREAAKQAARAAPLGPKILVDHVPTPPPEPSAKEAFESLFTPEQATTEIPADEPVETPAEVPDEKPEQATTEPPADVPVETQAETPVEKSEEP